MSTIITRNSATSGSTPSSLVQGELAINVTNGRLFYGSGSGNVVKEFNTVTSASFALTASFITASGVYGPYGSNSVISASHAETSSFSTAASANQILVLNQSGQNIAKGIVVHITASGNSSDIPRIITASYENDNNSANTLGISSQLITNGSTGYITTEGVVTGINTTAFTSGQLVYLGATGSITGSAPQAPLHSVRLGQVVRDQSNNGSIYVRIDNGYELGELHDVRDTTTTSSYGDLLVRSGSVWTNSKQLTGSYGLTGSLAATSFTGSLQGTASYATNALSASFAPSTPTFPFTGSALITGSLGVTGSASILAFTGSSATIFNIRNSANTADLISIQGNNIGNFSKVYFDLNSGTPQLFNTDTSAAAGASMLLGTTTISLRDANANFVRFIAGGTRSIAVSNGSANTGLADAFEIYSADRGGTAGRASAHFRSEDGTINVLGDLSGIGTASPGARLDVRAQGALSTDIAFRVRNSAGTANILTVNGDGTIIIPTTPKIDTTSGTFLQTNSFGSFTFGSTNSSITGLYDISCFGSNNTLNNSFDSYCVLGRNNNVAGMRNIVIGINNKTSGDTSMRLGHSYGQDTFGGNSSMHFGRAGGGGFLTYSANEVTNFFFNDYRTSQMFRGNGSILLSGKNSQILTDANVTTFMGDGGNTFIVRNHSNIPSLNITDSFQQYSTDITAGNAAPHFRTENGSIIKLYKEIQPALSGSANTGDPATDALIEAMKTIILNLGFGASS